MNHKPTEDILYVPTKQTVTFYGNSDRGCRWLQKNTNNNPHSIQREHLEDFLAVLEDSEITYECSNRIPEL